jgi:hypothetical protein
MYAIHVRRALETAWALSGGVASPQSLVDEARRRDAKLRGEISEETLDPEGVMTPDAGGERRYSGRAAHPLPTTELGTRTEARWQRFGRW